MSKCHSSNDANVSPSTIEDQKVFLYNQSDFPSLQEAFNNHSVGDCSKNSKVSLGKEADQSLSASTVKTVYSLNSEPHLHSLQETFKVSEEEELELPKDNLVKGKVRFSKPNLWLPDQLCERTGTPFGENILTYKRVYPFCFHNEDEIFVSKKLQKNRHSEKWQRSERGKQAYLEEQPEH